MKIAVVILNWNGKELLKQFLPSVVNCSPNAVVYVADNASTDDSVSFVETHFPRVKIIQNPDNGGYAKGYNQALKKLTEEVLVLLNSDVEVTKGWLEPFERHFQDNPQTAIAQPKLLDYKRKDYFEYAGAAGGFVDKYGFPFCRGRIFDTIEKDEGQYDQPCSIFWASGACLVIRRTAFEELGGLDNDYFAHQEEIDLCWRAHNAGYQTMYLPDSTVYHLGGATLNAMNPRKTFLNFRNCLFNLLKNVPGKAVGWIIFCRLCLDGIAGVKLLFQGKPRHTWAVVKAHFSFYRHFFRMREKRLTSFSTDNYYKLPSIVVAYFVRNMRKYSDL